MLIVALAACSGPDTTDTGPTTDTSPGHSQDTGAPTSATPTADTGPGYTVYDPTWAGMEQLFVDHCDVCHPSQQGLDLHTFLPNDITSGDHRYVVPGDPDASVLWQVLIGVGFQTPMPYGQDSLPEGEVDPVRVWIANGASLE